MKVRIIEVGEVPPRLAQTLLVRLPPPFEVGAVSSAAVPIERCYDHVRDQVDAARLLDFIPAPPDGWLVLGITVVDLFLPALTYVFGASALGHGRALLSLARLRAEDDGAIESKTLWHRLTVEAVHELGHARGLVHCPVGDCAMHRSMWPEGVDLKRAEYCLACLDAWRVLP